MSNELHLSEQRLLAFAATLDDASDAAMLPGRGKKTACVTSRLPQTRSLN
jgi:hypothetical protein